MLKMAGEGQSGMDVWVQLSFAVIVLPGLAHYFKGKLKDTSKQLSTDELT